jgi:hypothetical protein
LTGTSPAAVRPARQVPGHQLPFTSAFTALSPYQPASVGRMGMGRRAEKVVDLVAFASEHPNGITLAQAAVALFGGDTEPNRQAARLVVLRLCGAGRLRRVRPHDAGGCGGRPDRYVAVT